MLSPSERWESVRGAFVTRPGSQVDNLRVLLVDDVMPRRTALDACVRAVRDARVGSVAGSTVPSRWTPGERLLGRLLVSCSTLEGAR
jgi:predicted amidophosphoribosyltransferase